VSKREHSESVYLRQGGILEENYLLIAVLTVYRVPEPASGTHQSNVAPSVEWECNVWSWRVAYVIILLKIVSFQIFVIQMRMTSKVVLPCPQMHVFLIFAKIRSVFFLHEVGNRQTNRQMPSLRSGVPNYSHTSGVRCVRTPYQENT